MATKTCPACGIEVPNAARRCKECFHDFLETKPPTSGPLPLLIALAGMALVGSATFYYLTSQPTDQKILVNEATRTVTFEGFIRFGACVTDWRGAYAANKATS
jgi:hypothetical protein